MLPLWRHNPAGEYVFIAWSWSPSDQAEYHQSRVPPVDLLDQRLDPVLTVCLPLVAGAFYSSERGGTLKIPKYQQQNSDDQKLEAYFLNRPRDYLLLGDPCPAPLSAGVSNTDHPYLLIPSEHISPPPSKLAATRSLRAWLREAKDPFAFALPICEIHRLLATLLSSGESAIQVGHTVQVPRTDPAKYRRTVQDIWQSHADAAHEDAALNRSLNLGRFPQQYLFRRPKVL